MLQFQTPIWFCLYCRRPLLWSDERHCFVHATGHPEHRRPGSAYWQRCTKCTWEGAPYPNPLICPHCGGELRDDHAAFPIRSD